MPAMLQIRPALSHVWAGSPMNEGLTVKEMTRMAVVEVKFQLIATDLDLIAQNTDRRLARGVIERIGGEAIITLQAEGGAPQRSTSSLRDIRAAVDFIASWASSEESGIHEIRSVADLQAAGHRVAHGGERFTRSMLITDEVLRGIEDCGRSKACSTRNLD